VVHQAGTVPWSTAGTVFYFNDFLEAFTNHVGAPFDQSWSLAVEEQFYLVWPLVLALIATRFGLRGQRAIAVGLVAVSVVLWVPFGNYFLPTGHLVPLALGCWAAFWVAHGGALEGPAVFLRDGRVAVAAVAVFALALVYAPTGRTGQAVALAVDLAATALLLHSVLAAGSWPSRALSSALFRWIGVRSYGIYLYGLTLLVLVPAVTHLPLHEVVPVDLVTMALVVALSYRYVEAPLRARGRAWLASTADGDRSEGGVQAVTIGPPRPVPSLPVVSVD
jgi:peptidoglycan/LPS O-acetylase OafA/YrhL